MIRSIAALLDQLVDYAGLFPPSKLPMQQAAENFARYRRSEHAFALGRFVVQAPRLEELESVAASSFDGWHISALVTGEADLEAIALFNVRNSDRARVDSIEMKVSSVDDIARMAAAVPPTLAAFYELPLDRDVHSMIAETRARGGYAKIRTGGVTPDAFPAVEGVVRFVAACAKERASFKATAGLHHPLRCVRPLTYERDSVTGTMHGFVNLFLAATMLRNGGSEADAVELMNDSVASWFQATDDGISWRGRLIPTAAIVDTRRELALSFGSCSFEEPVLDLKDLDWL